MKLKEFHNQNFKFYYHLGIAQESDVVDKRIALILDEKFKDDYNAQRIFILSANMLARIYVNVDFIIPSKTLIHKDIHDIEAISLEEHIKTMCKYIFGQGNFVYLSEMQSPNLYDGSLYIGNTLTGINNNINVYSNGWTVYINKEVSISLLQNPIGANAAACFGVAELFKRVVGPKGCRYINDTSFSLLNYDTQIPNENPPLPPLVDIENLSLIGAGAVGSSFIYSLSSLQSVKGQLEIVDADKYSQSNLNRYVIADDSTIGMLKTDISERVLKCHSELNVTKHPVIFNDYVSLLKNPIDTLISAVDKRITRYNMQIELPRLILDAATTETIVDIHRVDFGTGGICLGCIYEPDKKDIEIYKYMADTLGMDIDRVRYLVDSNKGLQHEDISIISKTLNSDCSQYIDQPIDSLYAHEICGTAKMSISNDRVGTIAPLSFISVLAGVFLTAELIKDRYFHNYKLSNTFCIDTLKAPVPAFHSLKTSKESCKYCNDSDILEVYRNIWGTS